MSAADPKRQASLNRSRNDGLVAAILRPDPLDQPYHGVAGDGGRERKSEET